MNTGRPTYEELEKRLAVADQIIEALKHHEVDAVVGREKIALLLLQEVGDALASSDAGFNALFELPSIGMIQADTPALHFTRVNRKFCAMTGFSARELLARTYIDIIHPQDRTRVLHGLAGVLRGKTDAWSSEKRCVRKNGSVIRIEIHATALRDSSGRTLRIMAVVRDLALHPGTGGKVPALRAPGPPAAKARKRAGKKSQPRPRQR